VGPLDEPPERYAAVRREAAAARVPVSQPGLGEVREVGPRRFAAPGRPRDLERLPRDANLWGASFACARVTVHLARAAACVAASAPRR
jgi:hypothetical protein